MKHAAIIILAWVMWIHTQQPNQDSWSALTGFASEKHCFDNVKEKLQTWSQFHDAKFNGLSVTFAENKVTLSYLCLSDDQDPRREKPKKPR
jgi:hypothetical protein